MISTEFLLTSLVVVLVPGTGVIYTVSTGLMHRWQASISRRVGLYIGNRTAPDHQHIGFVGHPAYERPRFSGHQTGRGLVLTLSGLGHVAR